MGNKLPHPFTMFMMLTVMIVVIAQLLNGFTVPIPGEKRMRLSTVFLNKAGFQWFVNNILANFIAFPPFKTVLVTMLGVAVAGQTGLFEALSKFLEENTAVSADRLGDFRGRHVESGVGCGDRVYARAGSGAVCGSRGAVPLSVSRQGMPPPPPGIFANLMITSHDANLSGISPVRDGHCAHYSQAPMNVTVNWYMAIASRCWFPSARL